jgi:biopolymer transport protein ExbB/TolQ/ABC-type transporter Mla subunit MlaD
MMDVRKKIDEIITNGKNNFNQFNKKAKLIMVISMAMAVITLFWCFLQIIGGSSNEPTENIDKTGSVEINKIDNDYISELIQDYNKIIHTNDQKNQKSFENRYKPTQLGFNKNNNSLEQQPDGDFWAFTNSNPDNYWVVPNFTPFDGNLYKNAKMKKAFKLTGFNPKKQYNYIIVVKPAEYQKKGYFWRLKRPGQLRFEKSTYLWPENGIAQGVVVFQIVLFIGWFILLGYLCWRFLQLIQQIKKCEDLSLLVPDQHPIKLPKNKKSTIATDAQETKQLVMDRDKQFLDFCAAKGIDHQSPLAKHIRTLYESGRTENRLEIGQLLKHTTSVFFRENNLLRSILSAFIVIGLFGTLFGLADSLANMTGLEQGSEGIEKAIKSLMSSLKGAFAPSIWGILFTILGIFVYAAYLHLICNPLKSMLEFATLNTWVPKLFPATAQNLKETLELSKSQIYENLNSIKEVAGFAGRIETDIGTLEANLNSTNDTLVALMKSGSRIDQVVNNFSDSVKSLTKFQDDIKKLYEQLLTESSIFQSRIAATVDNSSEFQKDSLKLLDEYDARVQNHLKVLNSYEESYLNSRREIEAKIEEVLSITREAFDTTSEKDRQIIGELGKAIIGKLDSNLGKIATDLMDGLTAHKADYSMLTGALSNAAKNISGSWETIDSRMTKLVNNMENAVSRLEKAFNESMKEMNERTAKQIAEYTAVISQSKPVATPEIVALNSNLTNLTNAITKMNENTPKPAPVENKKNWFILAGAGVLAVFLITVSIAGYQINLSQKQLDQSKEIYQAITNLTEKQERLLKDIQASNKLVRKGQPTPIPTPVPTDNY